MNHIAYFKYILMMNKKINGYKLTASKPSSYDTLLNKLKVLKLMISFYKFLFSIARKDQSIQCMISTCCRSWRNSSSYIQHVNQCRNLGLSK